MRWSRLILPFVVVLVAVALVCAMVVRLDTKPYTCDYATDALDVDVGIAPAVIGEAGLERTAEPNYGDSAGLRDADATQNGIYTDLANKAPATRCICPTCASMSAMSDNCSYSANSGSTPGPKGARSPGVWAGSALKGADVEMSDSTVASRASVPLNRV